MATFSIPNKVNDIPVNSKRLDKESISEYINQLCEYIERNNSINHETSLHLRNTVNHIEYTLGDMTRNMNNMIEKIDQLTQTVVNMSIQLKQNTDFMLRHFGPNSQPVFDHYTQPQNSEELMRMIQSHPGPFGSFQPPHFGYTQFTHPQPAPMVTPPRMEAPVHTRTVSQISECADTLIGDMISFINSVVNTIKAFPRQKSSGCIYFASTPNFEKAIEDYNLQSAHIGHPMESDDPKFSKRIIALWFDKYQIRFVVKIQDLVSALEIITFKKE